MNYWRWCWPFCFSRVAHHWLIVRATVGPSHSVAAGGSCGPAARRSGCPGCRCIPNQTCSYSQCFPPRSTNSSATAQEKRAANATAAPHSTFQATPHAMHTRSKGSTQASHSVALCRRSEQPMLRLPRPPPAMCTRAWQRCGSGTPCTITRASIAECVPPAARCGWVSGCCQSWDVWNQLEPAETDSGGGCGREGIIAWGSPFCSFGT